MFQSSFELTGYITKSKINILCLISLRFQSSFELTGYITGIGFCKTEFVKGFKALSSLQVI